MLQGCFLGSRNVGEQDLFFLHQVRGEFLGQRGEGVIDGGKLGMVGPVLRGYFSQQALDGRNLLFHVNMVLTGNVVDQVL